MNDTQATRLREAREARGLTVLQLAALFQMQPAYIYAIESGARGAGVKTLRMYVQHELLTAREALGIDIEGAA